ncbi:uncharacterized protein LOC141641240 [Silene latifolia]|uniref:uncharacterized protein LOC141641240 n=1 Tax=Silene latifolia TaxID=37657 RepID=UPI003D76DF56
MTPTRNVDNAILQALTHILQNQQDIQQNLQNQPPLPPLLSFQKVKTRFLHLGDPVALTEWFRELEKSFALYDVREEDKVKLASHFLVKEADRWWSMTSPTSTLEPGFGWDRFKDLVEARFYPKELKQQRLKEFMNLKQGSLSVQAFTDKFNELAHYASRLVKNEEEKAFFYLDKLTPKLKSLIRRDSTSFVSIYDDALWAESSIRAIDEEARASHTSLGKRPLYSTSRHYVAPSRSFVPTSSPSYPNKKRFVPSGQANQGARLSPSNDKNPKGRMCYHCKKPLHPGIRCFDKKIVCFSCNKPGHKANECPEKKTTTTPAVPERPRGRILVMSRAEAEAHPDIVTDQKIVLKSPLGTRVSYQGVRKQTGVKLISAMKMVNALKKGHQAFLCVVTTPNSPSLPPLKDVPIVCEFPDVFPDELPEIPPERDVEFSIDLVPGTGPIA